MSVNKDAALMWLAFFETADEACCDEMLHELLRMIVPCTFGQGGLRQLKNELLYGRACLRYFERFGEEWTPF